MRHSYWIPAKEPPLSHRFVDIPREIDREGEWPIALRKEALRRHGNLVENARFHHIKIIRGDINPYQSLPDERLEISPGMRKGRVITLQDPQFFGPGKRFKLFFGGVHIRNRDTSLKA